MTRRAAAVAALLTLAAATGCSNARLAALRANPTPALTTHVETSDEMLNALAIDQDLDLRMLNDDLGRVMYLNRSSRLSKAPIPR